MINDHHIIFTYTIYLNKIYIDYLNEINYD